ncbi:KH domain-containing, RNA-binding, signal transduction-associated protein 3-like [Teleopsis dalmanni]|uniref:KH domain-containing, RNA-binding, signal transduction-associated protein 3-like n=1 Tax=Teleopsis dalmanni TaxID=139649 RepID=UPI0018CF800D|nr:KH domain-containing, RNA-binding, signal transduction-associated protein 3-like [Teleopsis dalmanni]XP_037953969.1 KH domain-containing, RNA-binding, signal transduction-associated protein 3-like [Teleopsis dalmanni]
MSEHSEEHVMNEPKATDHQQPKINEIAQKFLADLEEERDRLEESFPLCKLLIDEAFNKIYSTGRIPGKEYYADVYKQKPLKISQKVFVPVKQYPKFNFTGKILGPKGNSLRRLQEETQCKIAIKGRNSMRDRNKEEEMRSSGDPRYSHLNKDLFLEISTVSSPAESYARIAYALAEIRKYIVPDKNDEVSHEQFRELMEIDPQSVKQLNGSHPYINKSVLEKKLSGGPSGLSKYMNLIRNISYDQMEPEMEEPVEASYNPRAPNRQNQSVYGYAKARTAMPTGFKRQLVGPYATDTKRLREAPIKPFKPSSYSILNKYK